MRVNDYELYFISYSIIVCYLLQIYNIFQFLWYFQLCAMLLLCAQCNLQKNRNDILNMIFFFSKNILLNLERFIFVYKKINKYGNVVQIFEFNLVIARYFFGFLLFDSIYSIAELHPSQLRIRSTIYASLLQNYYIYIYIQLLRLYDNITI